MRAALRGVVGGLLAAHVADVGAAVVGGVGVHDFEIEAGIGDTQAIAFADYWSGVDDGDDQVFRIFATADERKNAVVGVVGVNPFESMPVEIDLVKGGFGGVKPVEVADEMLDATMGIVLQQVPLQAVGFTPFVTLGDLLTHKEEFLSRVSVLIGVEEAEIGKLLPHIAGHLVEQRVFSVDDFVVGNREKEIFGEGVEERE